MIELWAEGHCVTGSIMRAIHLGDFEADTLRDAVKQFKETLKSESERRYVDVDNLTYWGCRFFDNETDARKSFG